MSSKRPVRVVRATLGAFVIASTVSVAMPFLAIAAPPGIALVERRGPRQPEPPAPLHRGSELVALRDVELHQARIAEGSRVTVVELRFEHGALVSLSLALPDGYVLHGVSYERIVRSFRATKG